MVEHQKSGFRTTSPAEDYEVMGRLGEGAYGVVEMVKSKIDGEIAAAKIALKGKHSNATVNEIAILEKLSHPNILRLLAKYETASEYWLILEFCQHGSLYDFLRKINFNLDDSLISVITFDMLNALSYLHEKGIIHRDIKARNILLDADGICKISDFGISKDAAAGHTFIGSPLWMAPEQVATQHYTAQVDVWALGITLLEISEGKVPHNDKNPYAAMVSITQSDAPFLQRPERFSKNFQDFLRKCLVKDPNKRATIKQLMNHEHIKTQLGNHDFLRQRLINLFQRISCRDSLQSAAPRSTIMSRRMSDPTLESIDIKSQAEKASSSHSSVKGSKRLSRGGGNIPNLNRATSNGLVTLDEEPEETMTPNTKRHYTLKESTSLNKESEESAIGLFGGVKRSTIGGNSSRHPTMDKSPHSRMGVRPESSRGESEGDFPRGTQAFREGRSLSGDDILGLKPGYSERLRSNSKQSAFSKRNDQFQYQSTTNSQEERIVETLVQEDLLALSFQCNTLMDLKRFEQDLFSELSSIVTRHLSFD